MKIGICGAPGSGKTELAEQLKKALDKEGQPEYQVLDEYVEALREYTGLELGHWGNYTANHLVAMERLRHELAYLKRSENLIGCGTLIDTLVYAVVHGGKTMNRAEETARRDATMGAFGMMMSDCLPYEYLVWVPGDFEQGSWDRRINDLYSEAFHSFEIPFLTLGLDRSERPAKVLELVFAEEQKKEQDEPQKAE